MTCRVFWKHLVRSISGGHSSLLEACFYENSQLQSQSSTWWKCTNKFKFALKPQNTPQNEMWWHISTICYFLARLGARQDPSHIFDVSWQRDETAFARFFKGLQRANKSDYVLYTCWNVTNTVVEGAAEQYIIILCHFECFSGAIKPGIKSLNLRRPGCS